MLADVVVRDRQRGGAAGLALVAVAASVAALAVVAVAGWQLRHELQTLRLGSGMDLLWRLGEEWDSADMGDVRSAAAADLLAGNSSPDVDDVLGFFDRLALLVERGIVDEELACYEFFHPMASFWFASQDYVRKSQRGDAPWEHLAAMMPRLVAAEARRRHVADAAVVPERDQLRQFLQDERDSAECLDDDCDAGKSTPL